MSKILETVWHLEPHTAKKHEILRRYFQAWLPILGQTNGRLLSRVRGRQFLWDDARSGLQVIICVCT